MTEALDVLRSRGAAPALESVAMGSWVLEQGGLEPRGGLITVGEDRGDGRLERVPFARAAEWIAVVDGERLRVVARQDVTIRHGLNLAGEARDTVVLGDVAAELGDVVEREALRLRGALVRAVLMAGSLERIAEIAIDYAAERRQFGRPISRFQAVQAHLVTLAQQAALVGVAADAAAATRASFEVAAAKLLANRAAITAGRAAHQVLGARGVTFEHPLATETKQLWSWRVEYGAGREWSARLGTAAIAAGADRLYPTIASGGAELEV